jgi:hypothetical protein
VLDRDGVRRYEEAHVPVLVSQAVSHSGKETSPM